MSRAGLALVFPFLVAGCLGQGPPAGPTEPASSSTTSQASLPTPAEEAPAAGLASSFGFDGAADQWGYGYRLRSPDLLDCWLNRTYTLDANGRSMLSATVHLVDGEVAALGWQPVYRAARVEALGNDSDELPLPVVAGVSTFVWDESIAVPPSFGVRDIGFRFLHNRVSDLRLSITCKGPVDLAFEQGSSIIWGLDDPEGGPSYRVHGVGSHVEGATDPFTLDLPGGAYGVSHNGTGTASLLSAGPALVWDVGRDEVFISAVPPGSYSLALERDGQGDGDTDGFSEADVFWLGLAAFAPVDGLRGPE